MPTRPLGAGAPAVSALGLGCMGMSEHYAGRDEAEALATLDHALALGINFLDTADAYGPFTNEELLGRALRGRRARVVLATKVGIVRDAADPARRERCGRPAYVRAACEASLRRLGVDHVDLYYLHRIDPEVPIEETVGAMAELVGRGLVRHLGLSEASPASLARACAVHPIAALQSEYSLWSREVEGGVLAACRALGVAFVACSPLGRGFLAGRFGSPDELAGDDARRAQPRFQPAHFAANREAVARVAAFAAARGCTPAQLALAWLLARGPDVIAIPGTKRRRYLDENVGALAVRLTAEDVAALDALVPPSAFSGERYPAAAMAWIDR